MGLRVVAGCSRPFFMGRDIMSIIKMTGGKTRNPDWSLREGADFCLEEGEQLAIMGRNGAGKTLLVDMITGAHPLVLHGPEYGFRRGRMVSQEIRYIAFRDGYGDSGGEYYLQKRWNQTEVESDAPTVGELLDALGGDLAFRRKLYDMFDFWHVLSKKAVMMSSGELRKYQIIKAMRDAPSVMVMDSPFTGLDMSSREQLRDLLAGLAASGVLQLVLVLDRVEDIPSFITHVTEVLDGVVLPKKTLAEFKAGWRGSASGLAEEKKAALLSLPPRQSAPSDEVVRCNKVSIQYGDRVILKDLDWTVRKGERWALSGPNGAGKSTLLSLVCADNPQAYACDIALFGVQRGSGESIWDIKKRIGYVSPEMHRAYREDLPVSGIVASGFFDTVGLYRKPSEEQIRQGLFWMDLFGIGGLAGRSFLRISSGEQRLALLARAFVKDPELLVLDEPLHGLDEANRSLVKDVIEIFCQRPGKTLIMVTHYDSELPSCITDRLSLVRH